MASLPEDWSCYGCKTSDTIRQSLLDPHPVFIFNPEFTRMDPLHPSSKAKLLLQAIPDRQDAGKRDGVGVWRRGCSCVRYTGIARNTDDGGPWAGILSTLEALLPTKQPHLIPLVSHTIATILCLCHAKEKAGEGCAEILHLLRGESWFFKKRRL